MRLQLLSFNIHKGYSLHNQRYVLNQLRDALRTLSPDVVLLQEVKGQHPRQQMSAGADPIDSQFEFLADELWPHYAYGRNSVHDDGDHGNAILSKFPIFHHQNLDLSTNPLEARGLLHAIAELPDGQDLHLMCTHLNLRERGRAKQMRRIADYLARQIPHHMPVVLAGDFNDWRQNACHFMGRNLGLYDLHNTLNGARAKTFPSFRPILRLDRIYVSGLQPVQARVLSQPPWTELSDHLALFGEVDFHGTAEAAADARTQS